MKERGVDRGEGLQPARGLPGGEGDGVLLGDADVEAAMRKALGEELQPRPVGHRGRHRGNALVLRRLGDQAPGEDLGIGRRVGGRLLLLPRHHVELRDAVPLVGAFLGGGVALALPGDRVDQDRPVGAGLNRPEHREQLLHVVPVDRAEIGKAQLLEERAADGHVLQQVLRPLRALAEGARQQAHGALGGRLQLLERRAGIEPREVGRHRAGGRGDRHLVVVQDHDQPLAEMAGVVHRLVRHAGTHRPVADHRDGVAERRLAPLLRPGAEMARHREAERGGDGGRGMGGAERVVGAFRALGEAREPALLPQRADPVAPSGEDLVRVGLMAHVPD